MNDVTSYCDVTPVIQFGFVTLFVTSFPLAPLFALINNLFETRLDAYRMIKMFQRPTAMKAQDIGAWFNVIKLFAFMSVITNVSEICLSRSLSHLEAV